MSRPGDEIFWGKSGKGHRKNHQNQRPPFQGDSARSKGSSIAGSFDNVVITSYNNVRRFLSGSVNFFNPTPSFNIQVKIPDGPGDW